MILFRDTCEDEQLGNEEKMRNLAKLMDESHRSCDLDYECSDPKVTSSLINIVLIIP